MSPLHLFRGLSLFDKINGLAEVRVTERGRDIPLDWALHARSLQYHGMGEGSTTTTAGGPSASVGGLETNGRLQPLTSMKSSTKPFLPSPERQTTEPLSSPNKSSADLEARLSESHGHLKVSTISLTISGQSLDMSRLNQWLAALLWDTTDTKEQSSTGGAHEMPFDFMKMEIFRIKGVVAIGGESQKHILQAVHDLFEVVPSSEAWAPDEVRGAKIVVIGRNLQQTFMHRGLRACV